MRAPLTTDGGPEQPGDVQITCPQAHAFQLAFERSFLWKNRHGYVGLP